MSKISDLRQNYTKGELTEQSVCSDPITMFDQWFKDAQSIGTIEPNIFTLATADKDGVPNARVLLLKGYDQSGFVFFTNYNSRKSQEIGENPHVAMVFLWIQQERQVRVTGKIEKVSKDESEEYFHSRPRESQIGAWVSNQSSTIDSRDVLDEKQKQLEEIYSEGKEIPLPEHWGGFRIIPDKIEFWQGRANRLHDRILYAKIGAEWNISRLAP